MARRTTQERIESPAVMGEPGPRYFTARDLAHLLQVDATTVYRWAQQEPSMPTLRIGGIVRFPRERVLRWLDDHEQGHARPRRARALPSDPQITRQRADSPKSSSAQRER